MDDHVGPAPPRRTHPVWCNTETWCGAAARRNLRGTDMTCAGSPSLIAPPNPRNSWMIERSPRRSQSRARHARRPLRVRARADNILSDGLLLLSPSRTCGPLIAWNGNCLATGYARGESRGSQIVASRRRVSRGPGTDHWFQHGHGRTPAPHIAPRRMVGHRSRRESALLAAARARSQRHVERDIGGLSERGGTEPTGRSEDSIRCSAT